MRPSTGRATGPARTHRWQQNPHAVLAVLLLAGLVGRVVLAHSREYPTYDGSYYMGLGRDLAHFGKLPFSTFPPGFPALIAAVLLVLGTAPPLAPLRAAQGVNVVAGTLLAFLAFLVARRRVGPWGAVAVAAVILALPQQLTLSASDLSEMSYGCALLGGWLLYERARGLPAGLLWGLAYLIRPEVLVLVGVVLVIDLLRGRRRPAWTMLAGVAVWIVPYTVYLWRVTGQLLLTSKGMFLDQSLAEYSGLQFVPHYLNNLRAFVWALASRVGVPVLAAALLGALLTGGRWLLPLVPLASIPLFLFRMEDRFWAPYLPVVLTAAASLFPRVRAWIHQPRGRRVALAGLAALLLGGMVWTTVDEMAQIGREYDFYPGMRAAGLWLRPRVGRDTIIAGRKPYVSFWAWCRFARIPEHAGATSVVNWARKAGAEYLEVNAFVAATLTPELLPLVGEIPEHLKDQLELVHTTSIDGAPQQTTFLYRIKGVPSAAAARAQPAPAAAPPRAGGSS